MDGQEHGVIGDLLHVVGDLAEAEPWVDEETHDDDEKPKGWCLQHDESPGCACRVRLGPDEDSSLGDDDGDGCVSRIAMSPLPLIVVLGADRGVGQADEHEEDEEHDRNGDSKSVENAFRSVVVAQEEDGEADVPQQGADAAGGVDTTIAVHLGRMASDGEWPGQWDVDHDPEDEVDEVLMTGEGCDHDVGTHGSGGLLVGEEARMDDVDAAKDAHGDDIDDEDHGEESAVC